MSSVRLRQRYHAWMWDGISHPVTIWTGACLRSRAVASSLAAPQHLARGAHKGSVLKFVHTRTDDEMREAMFRQIGHLRRSCSLYDEGHLSEAERIAATLYVLFFDGTGRTKSIVGELRIKQNLTFPDSSAFPNDPLNAIRVGPPLCLVTQRGTYKPKLKGQEGYIVVSFNEWWSGIVFKTDRGLLISRRKLVFSTRAKDGGGHFDREMDDEAYHWLSAYGDLRLAQHKDVQLMIYVDKNEAISRSSDIKFLVNMDVDEKLLLVATTYDKKHMEGLTPVKNAHWASIRQIGWEADQALLQAGY